MKNDIFLVTTVLFVSIAFSALSQESDTLIDLRDGKIYKTVNIDTRTWMAENLAFEESEGCCIYDNDQNKIIELGYLYTWKTAVNVCPSGWHLPSMVEWDAMIEFLGGEDVAGTKMKSTKGWYEYGNGNNKSGFEGLPGGMRLITGKFTSIEKGATWWSSTPSNPIQAVYYSLSYLNTKTIKMVVPKKAAMSVRCIKD
jgi:uncharacterized protein (TIGR02145 family)